MLTELQKKNPHLTIVSAEAPDFAPYGKVHRHIQVPGMMAFLREQPMPEAELYIPCAQALMNSPEAELFTRYAYAQTPCQIGYFLARNTKLNAMEYHKCSEFLALDTDVVLLVGKIEEIRGDTWDTANIRAFYAEAGSVVELYATTLHFAPCMVSSQAGVRQVVVLSQNTNTPLDLPVENRAGENRLLLQKNKWVLAHKEAAQLLADGAHQGLIGENVEIVPL